jgi:hypothetical protein
MYIFGKRADKLSAEDIKRLVDNKVIESKFLDYKRELNISQDKDKKEFLFDITSMFNTDGGCLLYGIEESKDDKGQNTGTPERILGITIENYDKLLQQIEDIVKANSEPSITNLAFNNVSIEGKNVLIIGISKGLWLPSMVIFNETNKFYRRRNSGKYAVDVYELNQMFMQNQLLREAAEKFRLQRIDKVRNLKVFPNLKINASFFIQIIPYSFLSEQTLDFSKIENMELETLLRPMYSSSWDQMYNLDGYATFSKSQDKKKIDGYNQIFRNGIFEAYTTKIFESVESKNYGKVNCIEGRALIPSSLEVIKQALSAISKFYIEPPFIICISIHDIFGGAIRAANGEYSNQFMTNEIYLPPILMSTYEVDLYQILKPNFDILWQSVGFPSSPNM